MKPLIFFAILCSFSQSHADDIQQMCSDAQTAEVINFKTSYICGDVIDSSWDQIITTGTKEQILEKVSDVCETSSLKGAIPWLLLASPRLEVREAAHAWQEILANRLVMQLYPRSQSDYTEILKSSSQTRSTYTIENGSQVAGAFSLIGYDSMNLYLNLAKPIAFLLCQGLGTFGCSTTLIDAFDLTQVKIVGFGSVTMADQVQTVFVDSRFTQGLSIAALHILDLVKMAEAGQIPQSHLIDDLVSSFMKVGFDQATSLDLTFHFFALYGTRGSSMDLVKKLATTQNGPVMLAAYAITTSLGILDYYTSPSGHPYSLPAEVTTSCSYGSPYHFWMPAALSWQLVMNGHNANNAAVAGHILGLGYEIFSDTFTRDEPWRTLTLPVKSLKNNFTRFVIAANDAGAKYGAARAAGVQVENLNLDNRTEALIDVAPIQEALSADESKKLFDNKISYYAYWRKVFSPDTGFKN